MRKYVIGAAIGFTAVWAWAGIRVAREMAAEHKAHPDWDAEDWKLWADGVNEVKREEIKAAIDRHPAGKLSQAASDKAAEFRARRAQRQAAWAGMRGHEHHER